MRPVGDDFLRAVRGSHGAVFRALAVTGHQTGVSPLGVELPIEDGDVEFDASADVRATLDLTTTPEFWPSSVTDLVTPYGTEIFVARGIRLGGGAKAFVSQGYYRVYSVEQDHAPRGSVRIAGRDRMSGIIDARLEQPRQFTGVSIEAVFDALVLDVYPEAVIEFDFDAAGEVLAGSRIAEEDRFGFLDDLVRALGKVWHWDYRGVLVIKDPPDPGHPVWDINHGRDGVLISAGRARNRDGVYNSVVVTGEAPGDATPPAFAIARDMSPTSPTRWGGPFGKVPRYYSSDFVTTNPQAATAAASILKQEAGLPYSVSFETVVNSALEVLDPIRVSYSDRDAVETHVLDKVRVPLVASKAMTGQTRDHSAIDVEVIT